MLPVLTESTADIAAEAAEAAPVVAEAAGNVGQQVAHTPNLLLDILAQVSSGTVYLMGFSFILGCLFTILILILLDFMRRNASSSDR